MPAKDMTSISVSKKTLQKVNRCSALYRFLNSKNATHDEVVNAMAECFLKTNDPYKKK